MNRRRPHEDARCLLDVPFGSYERHILRRYALAALTPPPGRRELVFSAELADWYAANRKLLGFRIAPVERYLRGARVEAEGDEALNVMMTRAVHGVRADFPPHLVPALEPATTRPSALQARLGFVARTLGLRKDDAAVLGAVVRLSLVPRFREFYAAAESEPSVFEEVDGRFAMRVAGIPERRSIKTLGGRAPLVELGLIEDRGGHDVAVSRIVADILGQRTSDDRRLRASLFGAAPRPALEPEDFAHLGEGRERLLALLDGALERGATGASVLLHGPPGTGKTEFARLLGKELGADVVFIGETAREGRRHDEPSREDRLAHLSFASALANRAGRVVLVIDEADDVFAGVDADSDRVGSKVFMNRVVETCPVPMVWITNRAHRLGPAVLRRMLMALEFREPGPAVKKRIVARHATRANLSLDDAQIQRLAALPGSPALIGSGLRAADRARARRPDAADTAEAVIASLNKVTGRTGPVPYPAGPIAFDATLSNADTDLAALEEKVVKAGPGPLSFLLAGLPGTGKSAFARHLADRLGLVLIEKRASDLLGMYVGENEKNIAEAFAEAVEARAFLLFDEVDSLLCDRAGAVRFWEVSLVNEMLTHLERHPLPVAATTNLAARLDPAVQRRFLFKVEFRAMTAAQKREAFARAFAVPAPASLDRLDPLTPADVALVARKAAVLGETDADTLAAMLAAEVAAKPGARRRIGF